MKDYLSYSALPFDDNGIELWRRRRLRRSKIVPVAIGAVLFICLVLCFPLVLYAQDGSGNQLTNNSNTDQTQDVIINQNCSQGAVCNANVGAPEPPIELQSNTLPRPAEPVAESPGNCPEGRAWDDDFGRCTAIQAYQNQKAERFGYAIALLGLMLVIGAVVLRWLGGSGSDKYSGYY